MPWGPEDAYGHTKKADRPVEKRQWAHVADSMLAAGKSEESAIRGANSVVAKRKGGKPKSGLHRAFGSDHRG